MLLRPTEDVLDKVRKVSIFSRLRGFCVEREIAQDTLVCAFEKALNVAHPLLFIVATFPGAKVESYLD